jgi:D-tyrosyl-tRNA(Tyr) deacylase
MKVVIQRVAQAKVIVGDRVVSEIKHGLLILLGIKKGDTEQKAQTLAERCSNLRIFEDESGKFNLSVKDRRGGALVVSQFTLLADTSRGRRPSFIDAEEPGRAKAIYEFFIATLNHLGIPTQGGCFGERMLVSLDNQGPVTIIMEE